MNFVEECSIAATLRPPLPIGQGPIGTRMYYEVSGGEIIGERLRGKLLGGGDWGLIGPDGFLRLDVRLQAETHDGALIYIQYTGLLELNDKVQTALANGTGTDFSDQYIYSNPRMETGDERYAWVNTTFFVGEGCIRPDLGVGYRIWRPA